MTAGMVRPVLILLVAILCGSASAVDTKRFEILKGIHYFQVADGVVYLQTNNMYRFSTQVYADVVGNVLGSSIYTPVHPRIDLLPNIDGNPFAFKDKFDAESEFEGNFPNGTYSLGIRGAHDGDHTMTFNLTGNVYPSTPVVNDYEGLQDLVYNVYNEISWQPFTGGTADDFIQFQIENTRGDNVWETPDFGENGALDGRATRTILPASVLVPGVVYVGTIRFVKGLYGSSLDYPGAVGTVGYFKRTQFTIRPKLVSGLNPVVDRLQIWRRYLLEQFADGSMTEQIVPWQFESKLDAISSNQVTGVRVHLPSGLTTNLVANETFTEFESSTATNRTMFVSTYKDGAYTFDISKIDATVESAVVNLPAGSFPAAPTLLNVASMTNHPAGEPITVSWQPWAGSGEQDFIRVELSNEDGKVWDTPNFSSPKHLRPTETAITIAGTNFVAGHDYTVQVHFYRVNVSDVAVIPGALVFGGFDTRTKFEFSTQNPDVLSFRVADGRFFWQKGTNRIEADPATYRFEAIANAATTNSLRSARVTTPRNETLELAPPTSTNKVFKLTAVESTEAALVTRYPAGTYTMQLDTATDGLRNASIALLSTEFPPVPFILNFSNVFKIVPSGDFKLRWQSWTGADTNTDRIQFTVERLNGSLVIDSSDDNTSHPLSVNSTEVTILGPHLDEFGNSVPQELSLNQSYIARLRFERRNKVESQTYPGARGTAAVFSELAFYISTLSPTYISNFKDTCTIVNGSLQISVPFSPLQINRPYTLFQTHDFTNWTIAKIEALNVPYFRIPLPSEPTFYKAAILP